MPIDRILQVPPSPILSTICIALLLTLLAAQEIPSNLGARWHSLARLLNVVSYPLLGFFAIVVAMRVSAAVAGMGR